MYLVGDCLTDLQYPDSVASVRFIAPKTLDDLPVKLGISRRRAPGQVQTDKAFPGLQCHRQQSKRCAVKLLIVHHVGRTYQAYIEYAGPHMIATLGAASEMSTSV